MKVTKRLIAIPVILLAIGAAAAWYFLKGGGDENGPLTIYGNVDIRQVELGFRVGGRIDRMPFEEGDRVEAGTVIAQLDTAPLAQEVALAEAEAEAKEANLRKLEAGPRPQEIEQARALVAERRAALDNARRTFERQRELLERGNTSRQAYDDARARLDQAQAALQSAQESFNLLTAGFRREDIAAARAELRAARARLDLARTRLADARLVAPEEGIILSRVREPGAIVAAGQTVYTLSLTTPIWVRAYVPEPDLGRVRPGMRAEVITDTRPDQPYEGQVGFISPVAEFTPRNVETPDLRTDLVYRLRVIVRNADGGLRQGMPVTVRLGFEEEAGAAE